MATLPPHPSSPPLPAYQPPPGMQTTGSPLSHTTSRSPSLTSDSGRPARKAGASGNTGAAPRRTSSSTSSYRTGEWTRSDGHVDVGDEPDESFNFGRRRPSLDTPRLNPYHILSQSQAQYVSSAAPLSKSVSHSAGFPEQEVHIRKISKDEVVVVAGKTGDGVVRKVGQKLKGIVTLGSGDVSPTSDAFEPTFSDPVQAADDHAAAPAPRVARPARSALPPVLHSFTAPPSPPPSDEEGVASSEDEARLQAAEGVSPTTRTFPPTRAPAARASPASQLSPALAPSLPIFDEPFAMADPTSAGQVLQDVPMAESPTESAEDDLLPPLPSAASVHGRRPSAVSNRSLASRSHSPPEPSPISYFDGASLSTPSSPVARPASSAAGDAPPSPAHLHPSSALLVPPSSFARRNITGSPPVPAAGSSSFDIPDSPSKMSKSFSSPSGRWSPMPSPTSAQPPSTLVPGIDGSKLDSDIITQAETIRRERLARRAKKAQLDEETSAASRPSIDVQSAHGEHASAGPGPQTARTRMGSFTQQARQQSKQVVEDTKVLVGNLVGEDHVNYILMYNMLTGIRIAVSRTQAKISRPLTDEDFTARHKFSFDIVGNELTPSARYDFKFKDYAPWVFRDLRDNFFHLDAADYLLSLTAKYILSELGSPGKSGSFFYFSRDYKFIIKTISHTEHKFLRSILPHYHAHIKANPHTLLSRFYGLHRVKLPRGRKIHFVIMNNLFPPHRDIHETYDLKGSSVGREYPEEKARIKTGAVLKDINWVRRNRTLQLGPEKAALLSEQLRRDAEFLKARGIMDHSLLIGIHRMERGNRDAVRENTLQVFDPTPAPALGLVRRRPSSVQNPAEAMALRKAVQKSDPRSFIDVAGVLSAKDGTTDRQHVLFYQDEGGLRATDSCNQDLDEVYYLGVIDICTKYRSAKKIEHFWKSLTDDRHAISAVPPHEYGDRFLNFLLSVMPGADKTLRPRGLRPEDVHPPDPADEVDNNEHIRHKDEKPRLKGE